jgi:multicomponent Na+:H+ antiporter subunit E
MRRAVLIAWLTVLWVVLWGEISLANVLGGVVVAVMVTTVFRLAPAPEQRHTFRPYRAFVFAAYFLWQLLVSNFVVAREVVTPRDRIRSGIVAVPVTGCSDLVITVLANALTLTPGTQTLEVRREPPTLYVHVLHLHDIDEVRRDIRRLQLMVVHAIGSQEALASLDERDVYLQRDHRPNPRLTIDTEEQPR